MEYIERKIKDIIKESIWEGIVKGSHVATRENPAAVAELLHQNQEWLNELTAKTFDQIDAKFVQMYNER